MDIKSTINYNLPPEKVSEVIMSSVMSGFEGINNAIIVDFNTLPPFISRQTFCVLAGIKPGKYHELVKNGIIKCVIRDSGKKISYDVTREEFLNFYKKTKNKYYAQKSSF